MDDPATSPNPNGCSTPTGNNPAWAACGSSSSFLEACNTHDTRYQTCGYSKFSADYEFSQNLAAVCQPFSGDCEESCDDWADYYAGAVTLVGINYWKDGQVGACACCNCE